MVIDNLPFLLLTFPFNCLMTLFDFCFIFAVNDLARVTNMFVLDFLIQYLFPLRKKKDIRY